MKKVLLIIYFFFFFTLSSFTYSENIKILNIDIKGNKSISANTILEIAGLDNKKFETNIDNLNLIQKKIFSSNFFSKVEIEINGSKLVINVIENPLIDFVIFEGIDDYPNLKKKIEEAISLKPNLIYSESLLNNDITFIKEYLSSEGFLQAEIKYTIKKLNNNRLNIFFQINSGNKFKVKNIYFIGDKKYSSARLSRYISTTESSWHNFFSSSSVPSSDRLNLDILNIKNFYLSEGYYDVQIPNASIEIIDNEFANVTFVIDSGNKFLIDNFKIVNNSLNLKKDDLYKINLLGMKLVNNLYNNKEISNLRDDIILYLENREFNSYINYSIDKIVGRDSLSLIFEINDYKEKKLISNIKVLGNEITEESVIRNNILFSEGDIFNNSKIKKSEDLLKSLGIFKKVFIKELSDNKDNQKSYIEIMVEEQPTGEIGSGIGIGTAGSSISFLLRENNFLGKAIKTDISLNLSTEQTTANISVNNPDYNFSGKSLFFNTYVSRSSFDNSEYNNKLIGTNISTKYEVSRNLSLETGFGLSYDSIDVSSSASSILQTQEGNFFTDKFFYDFVFDKTNKKFDPNDGYIFSFSQEYAIIPSDIPYISNSIRGTVYSKFSEDFLGNFKYRIKTINSLNNKAMKLSDRVFPSSNELRGFAYRSVGPKVNDDFIGGNYIVSTTLSSSFPNGLPETWKASTSIFLDAANVWGSDLDNVSNSSKVRSSVGVGLTWNSPIGPIGLSYAESLSKLSTDKTENFSFRIGSVF